MLGGGIRAGFRLAGADGVSAASGTQIEGFVFDGRGVSAANLEPLGLAIIGAFANDVRVERNRILGTVQGITNTGGDRWVIVHNVIDDLTVFDCTGALCGGGDGIVIQLATSAPDSRPSRNFVAGNVVNGAIPDGFGVFSMVGVFVFAADGTVVTRNRLSIPDNPNAEAIGQGVLVDNSCCGQPAVTPGARNTVVTFNDGRDSEIGVEIDGTGGENTGGLVLFGNLGPVVVEGALVDDGPRPRRPFAHGRRLPTARCSATDRRPAPFCRSATTRVGGAPTKAVPWSRRRPMRRVGSSRATVVATRYRRCACSRAGSKGASRTEPRAARWRSADARGRGRQPGVDVAEALGWG